jgi:hypothetical protein
MKPGGRVSGRGDEVMSKHFAEDGVSFSYPDNWRLEREEADNGWTVSLQSPGTAFLTVTFDADMPDTQEMAEAALEALREEYPTLEASSHIDTLAGQMAVGHDIEFFSFDLTNTCWTRSLYADAGTLLVLCQTNDLELDEYGPVLRTICASLKVEET